MPSCNRRGEPNDMPAPKEENAVLTRTEGEEHTNRLIHETSPYLLQHAHNPVDWYPWGEEAFERARAEDKPILLSIGYSACHWCHVMERESFENEEIAALMNEKFVCIKVDREERPDVDNVYMTAVQMMTGRGGWPLTVFLTPEKKPFFGGTYFPPEDSAGRPGFRSILRRVAEFYAANSGSEEAMAKIDKLAEQIRASSAGRIGGGDVDEVDLSVAVDRLARRFDMRWGGFGGAPKFPSASTLGLLLRHHFRTGDAHSLEMATVTLDRMMEGGIYDQLGGGFHRYSTDNKWLIPHFEKMLYDNALLAPAYLDGWLVTGKEEYRRVVEEILAYIEREMRDPAGVFYSSQDADSEGEEGKYYVWTRAGILDLLGGKTGTFVADYFGVTEEGSFENGSSALHIAVPLEEAAKKNSLTFDEAKRLLDESRRKMLAARDLRVAPAKDDKTILSWNGMAISAFARAGRAFGEEHYIDTAERAARLILDEMTDGDVLLHTWKNGKAKIPGYLTDYADFTQALIDLYEATWKIDYLKEALFWNGRMVALFSDADGGGFYFTGTNNEKLLARSKDLFDGSVPSGNSVAAFNLARLAKLTGDTKLREEADRTFRCFARSLLQQPTAATTLLAALDFHYGESREIVVVGNRNDPSVGRFLRKVSSLYAPDAVTAYLDPSKDAAEPVALLPLLEGKEDVGEPSVFVCRNYVCDAPVHDDDALDAALEMTVTQ